MSSASEKPVSQGENTAGERMDLAEKALFEQLYVLQESYRLAAQPIINRIVQIRSLRLPEPIFISRSFDPMTSHWFDTPAVTSPAPGPMSNADETKE